MKPHILGGIKQAAVMVEHVDGTKYIYYIPVVSEALLDIERTPRWNSYRLPAEVPGYRTDLTFRFEDVIYEQHDYQPGADPFAAPPESIMGPRKEIER